jgi:hypothetical protein
MSDGGVVALSKRPPICVHSFARPITHLNARKRGLSLRAARENRSARLEMSWREKSPTNSYRPKESKSCTPTGMSRWPCIE